jgi:hypothetical protein
MPKKVKAHVHYTNLFLQICVGAGEVHDKTIVLSYGVPMFIILIITLLTDVYTFIRINYYISSTHRAENQFLKEICGVCNNHCNDQSIVKLKVDIPLKSTITSFILLTLIFMIVSGQSFLLPLYYDSTFKDVDTIFFLFFTAINMPMIVFLSKKNNFDNISSERQRINTLAWNRTHNQQWEIKCARENRIQRDSPRTATDMDGTLHTDI